MLNTPKGFRDFVGPAAKKRQFVVAKLRKVFEKYGFEPLETPTLEFADTLLGKYGEEEKLIYQFETKGGDQVALRYDQTVPLARVLAQYPEIAKPYKRYQIQPVFRGENTQKGRYREFLQVDIDTTGTDSILADAEIVALALEAMSVLGFKTPVMKINDRAVFGDTDSKYISAIDKLEKIGYEAVIAELVDKGLDKSQAENLLKEIKKAPKTASLEKLFEYLKQMGVKEENIEYEPTLARGLNYYTGAIFELTDASYPFGSLGGGGRYDKLLSIFNESEIPATGFSFGFDRLLEAMEELSLFEDLKEDSKRVLVTIFNAELLESSLNVYKTLKEAGINTELYLDENARLDKQLKYADQKGFSYAVIIGPDEARENLVTLKDLNAKTQEKGSLSELINSSLK